MSTCWMLAAGGLTTAIHGFYAVLDYCASCCGREMWPSSIQVFSRIKDKFWRRVVVEGLAWQTWAFRVFPRITAKPNLRDKEK